MLRVAGEAGVEDARHPPFQEVADRQRMSDWRRMRRSSVSSPFSTTQVLNADSVGPVLRVNGSVLVMKSSVPHRAG